MFITIYSQYCQHQFINYCIKCFISAVCNRQFKGAGGVPRHAEIKHFQTVCITIFFYYYYKRHITTNLQKLETRFANVRSRLDLIYACFSSILPVLELLLKFQLAILQNTPKTVKNPIKYKIYREDEKIFVCMTRIYSTDLNFKGISLR